MKYLCEHTTHNSRARKTKCAGSRCQYFHWLVVCSAVSACNHHTTHIPFQIQQPTQAVHCHATKIAPWPKWWACQGESHYPSLFTPLDPHVHVVLLLPTCSSTCTFLFPPFQSDSPVIYLSLCLDVLPVLLAAPVLPQPDL